MVEISEIVDRASLQAWLEALPSETEADQAELRRIAVSFAVRAAQRVMPVWWQAVAQNSQLKREGLTPLSSLRSLLISSVATVRPTEDIRAASAAAAASASAFASSAASAAAASAAAASAFASAAAASAASASAAIWPVVRADCEILSGGGTVMANPLWPEENPLGDVWKDVRSHLAQSGEAEAWAFWTDWYERILDPKGQEPNWDMLEEIALIPSKTWDAGPDVALPVINAIWERYRLEALIAENPLALRIERSDLTGKLTATEIEERDMSLVVADIRTALTEFVRRCKAGTGNLGPAMQTACHDTIKELRGRLSRVKENPRELLRLLEETRHSLMQIARNEGFEKDERLDRLVGNLERREEDVCANAPEVLAEVKARLKVRVQLYTADQMRAATRISTGMFSDSAGMLAAALARAVIIVNSEDSTEAELQGAWTFLAGALPRGARAMREGDAVGADPSKDDDVLDKLVSHADKANKLDKGMDAIQEAIAEGVPWTVDVMSQIQSGNFWGLGS